MTVEIRVITILYKNVYDVHLPGFSRLSVDGKNNYSIILLIILILWKETRAVTPKWDDIISQTIVYNII
jgi:hypothetical protein